MDYSTLLLRTTSYDIQKSLREALDVDHNSLCDNLTWSQICRFTSKLDQAIFLADRLEKVHLLDDLAGRKQKVLASLHLSSEAEMTKEEMEYALRNLGKDAAYTELADEFDELNLERFLDLNNKDNHTTLSRNREENDSSPDV